MIEITEQKVIWNKNIQKIKNVLLNVFELFFLEQIIVAISQANKNLFQLYFVAKKRNQQPSKNNIF